MREDNSSKRPWVKYLVTAASGFAAAFIVCMVRDIFHAEGAKEIVRILCDAFTFVALALIGCGFLTVLNKAGAFDGLGYTFQSMKRVWQNYRHDDENTPKTYYDYKKAVEKKRSRKWYLVIVGAGYLIVAVVLIFVHGAMS